MHHGTLLSFAILALLAASPADATPTGVPAGPPARVEAPLAPEISAVLPSMREGGHEVRLYRVASEGTEDQPEQSAAVMVDNGQALDAAPAKPMIIAVAGDGAAGHPTPLGITVVPAPHPPANAVSVLISGLPPGSLLSRGEDRGAGIWRIGLKNFDGLWSAGLMDLDDLSLTVPPDYIGTIDLKVTALAMHDKISLKSNTQSLSVTFDPPPAADTALVEATGPVVRDEPPAPVAVEEPPLPAAPTPPTDAEPGGSELAAPEPLPVEAPQIETVIPPNPAETERADASVRATQAEVAMVPGAMESGAMEPGAEESGLIDEPNSDGNGSTAPATVVPIPAPAVADEIDGPAARSPAPDAAQPPAASTVPPTLPPLGPPVAPPSHEEWPVAEPASTADSAEETVAAPPGEAPASARSVSGRTQTAALGDGVPAPAPSQPDESIAAKAVPSAAPAPVGSAGVLPEDLVMERGDALLAQGDLAGARLFYEFGLGTGSGRAAFALGKTYDPLVHRQLGVRGVPPDPAKAVDWYRTAIAAGNTEAERWLQDLTAWLDHGR
ncbi:hypothetical protein [Rhodospirillaceae bacterium SYSU D60014]|uniref:hypothetical protein n=1 Tax=Virgifigura deserti TaxID=2268457 RepID=UPI000E673D01